MAKYGNPPPRRVSLRFSRVSPPPPLLLTSSLIPGPLGEATEAAKALCCLPLVPDCCIRDRLVPTHQPPPTTHQRAPVTSYPPPITITNPSRHSNDVSGSEQAPKRSRSLGSPAVVSCPPHPPFRLRCAPTRLTQHLITTYAPYRPQMTPMERLESPNTLVSSDHHLPTCPRTHPYASTRPLNPRRHPLQPSNDVDGAEREPKRSR